MEGNEVPAGAKASSSSEDAYAYACLAALTPALLLLEPSSKAPSSMSPPSVVRLAAMDALARLTAEASASSASEAALGAYARLAALTLALSSLEP